jgi:hypothetical protein
LVTVSGLEHHRYYRLVTVIYRYHRLVTGTYVGNHRYHRLVTVKIGRRSPLTPFGDGGPGRDLVFLY